MWAIGAGTAVAVAVFAVTTCGTPGPNNVLIMSSGANFGFRKSIPGILGINCGFPFMVVAVGLGFAEVLHKYPNVISYLKPIAVLYLLWLAFGIARSSPAKDSHALRPPGFWRLLTFQPVNPKSWIMVLGALSAYTTPSGGLNEILTIAIIFLVFGTPCTVAWCLFGSAANRVIGSRWGLRVFNVSMASLLAISAIFVLIE